MRLVVISLNPGPCAEVMIETLQLITIWSVWIMNLIISLACAECASIPVPLPVSPNHTSSYSAIMQEQISIALNYIPSFVQLPRTTQNLSPFLSCGNGISCCQRHDRHWQGILFDSEDSTAGGIVIKQKEGLLQQVDLKVSFVYIHSYNVTCYNETGISDYARNVSNRFEIPHTQTSAELEKRSNFPTASLGTDTTI